MQTHMDVHMHAHKNTNTHMYKNKMDYNEMFHCENIRIPLIGKALDETSYCSEFWWLVIILKPDTSRLIAKTQKQ